jgi:PIN domain nuclease of toxin-antitoxin system
MERLLDSHVLISLIQNRLSDAWRSAFAELDAHLHTSVASLWEIAIKFRLGRLPLSVEPEDLPELVERNGAQGVADQSRACGRARQSRTRDRRSLRPTSPCPMFHRANAACDA